MTKCQHCDAEVLSNRMGTTPEMQKMYDEFGGAYTDQPIFDAIAASTQIDFEPDGIPRIVMSAEKFIEVFNNHRDRTLCTSLALAATPAVGGEALGYATRLLEGFVAEHFPHNPDWKPLPDLIGVLTQIDNAITIARDYKARLSAQPASPLRGRDILLDLAKAHAEQIAKHSEALFDKNSTSSNWHGGRVNGLATALEIVRAALSASPPEQPAAYPVTGALNFVEQAAILIWCELCPGIMMGDDDLPHYEAAIRKAMRDLQSPMDKETQA